MLKINFLIISFYILERLAELFVSSRNRKLLERDFTLEVLNPTESRQMKVFHASWFVLLLSETFLYGETLVGFNFYAIAFVLLIAQGLRWYAIYTLGRYWSVDVYQMKYHVRIETGPYAYMRHPNYLAVVMEFFFLPLLLGCPMTLVVGTLGNLVILTRRIKMEDHALLAQTYR